MASHSLHLAKLDSLASSSKQKITNLEKNVAESKAELLGLKESVKNRDNLIRLATEKENKLSEELSVLKEKNLKLEKKLKNEVAKSRGAEMMHARDIKKLSDKVAYYELEEYMAKVLETFQSSKKFEFVVLEKACVFYEWGINHVIKQFH